MNQWGREGDRSLSSTSLSKSSKLDKAANSAVTPGSAIALSAIDLHKAYGRGKGRFEAVRGVNLEIAAGEVLAFLGPNGAGKTTTIKMIAGLIRPDRGAVRISGLDPHRQPQALARVGAVLEGNRNLYWRLTAIENLEYFGVLRGMAAKTARRQGRELLAQFGLMDKATTPVQKLSRGMQQKLAIAVALVHQPRLLLLDEPTLGLDVEASQTVKGLVRTIAAQGCAILLTTHQLDVAEELSDRVAVIRQGQIVAIEPTQALIRQFAGNTYRLDLALAPDQSLEEALGPERLEKLSYWGAQIHPDHLTYSGDAVDLYALLDCLKPLPIDGIHRHQPDLTEVFLTLVNTADDSAASLRR